MVTLQFYYPSESPGGLTNTQVIGPRPQRFWKNESGVRLKDLHFLLASNDNDIAGLGITVCLTLLEFKPYTYVVYGI